MELLVEFLIDATGVEEVPISRDMKKLEVLSANNCRYLREIPASIGSPVNLRRLSLINSRIEELLDSIGQSASLVERNFSYTRISRLPDFVGDLHNLESLKINYTAITCLPDGVQNQFLESPKAGEAFLLELKQLPLSGDFELKEECLSSLKRLKKLLLDSVEICALPKEVRFCSEISEIKGLGNLISLKLLLTDSCCPVIKLDGLKRLEDLTRLFAISFEVERLSDLLNLKSLQYLRVEQSRKLVEIQGLSSLSNLKSLKISGCTSLKRLPELPNSLVILDIEGRKQISEIEAVGELKSSPCGNWT
ncbi:disease resistance protein TAO1-like [Punica granatum]|uniref:Disease resistance protein TAO1-like n=1 Tax=Punica granatum TaxID=22663 RepID=A0A6P8CVX6_PUNGR|nr:disease resistance protein TAO1-like [Punica granatum]